MANPAPLTDRTVSFLVRRRKTNAWLAIAAVGLFSLFALKIRFENSVESFIPPNDPDRIYYDAFREEFGDDQVIVLAIPVGEVFTRGNLERIESLSKELEQIPGVRKVRSITKTQDIAGAEGGFEVRPFIDKIPRDPETLNQLKQSALSNPLYKIDLVSLDGKIASIIIEPELSREPDRYKKIVERTREALARSPFEESDYSLSGDPMVELQMTEDMWKDLKVFVPATYLCLAALLLLLFHSAAVVAALLLVVSLCMGWLMGFIGATTHTMNAVTVGLPSLMLCIVVLDAIHFMTLFQFHARRQVPKEEAIALALRENMKPCWLTTVTTVVGFISLCVSELVPIRQFGFLGACSVLAAFPITLLVLPRLLDFMPAGAAAKEPPGWLTGLLRRAENLSMGVSKTAMVLVIAAAVGVSVAGIAKIKVETNHIKFLREHSPVRVATDFIEKNLGGVSPLEIVVETGADDGVKDPRVLKQIEAFQAYMESLPVVDKTVSPVQFIKEMHQAMNEERPGFYFVPDSRELIAQYLLIYSFSGRDNDLDDFVDYTYSKARIRGRMQQQSSSELRQTLGLINTFAKSNFDPELKVRITSHSLLQANMVDMLVEGQVGGLGAETAVMALIFSLVHRSVVVGLFSLIPNLLPLILSAGFMGFAGISLNAGTAMTIGIAFGLVVDDTVHFFHHASVCARRRKDARAITREIFDSVGPAVLFTSLLLAAGFGILVLGQSYLTVLFGVICCFTILSALACELAVSPFLLRFPLLQKGLRQADNKKSDGSP